MQLWRFVNMIKKDYPFKEIRVNTYSGFFEHPKYEETLKISSNWISYKKSVVITPIDKESFDKEEEIKWDYKTNNPLFEEKYSSLCESFLYYKKSKRGEVLDASSFCITLIKNDGTKEKLNFDLDVNEQQDISLRKIANQILDMIPRDEAYPECLRHQEIYDVDLSQVLSVVEELKKSPKIKIVYPEQNNADPNTLIIGYPDYPKWLYPISDGELIETDFEYLKNYEKFFGQKAPEEIDEEKLTFEQIKTLITFFRQQEKFCDGHMAHLIENGCLLKWLEQLIRLHGGLEE